MRHATCSGSCQTINPDAGERRLPITKKSIERKDGGVVACQTVSPGHLHRVPRFRGDTGYQEYLYRRCGQELVRQSIEFCPDNFCCLLCPHHQFSEEFLNHADNEKSVRGYLKQPYPRGYMNRFCTDSCQKNRYSGNEK
jgi:hypothetical protein